jgi:hypothetical protein
MTIRPFPALCCALACALALPLSPRASHAQTARDSVVATVEAFFRTMERNDAAGAARILTTDGVSYATRRAGDSVVVRSATFRSHLERLQAARDTILERMWNPTVEVHGTVAMVWTPYDLYRNGVFSHCGVDAFTLVRGTQGWLVSSVSYTIEPTGCAPSPLGPPNR